MIDGAVAANVAAHVLGELALALAHWPYFLPLLIALFGMGGRLGRGLGLPNLFRDDDQIFDPPNSWRPFEPPAGRKPPRIFASPAFWSGFGFMAAFGLFWMVVHAGKLACGTIDAPAACPTTLYLNPRPVDAAFEFMLWALAAAAVVLLALNTLQLSRRRADFVRLRLARIAAELRRLVAGVALGIAFTLAGYMIPFLLADLPIAGTIVGQSFLLPCLLFVIVVMWRRNALPCTSIFSLVMTLLLIGAIYPDNWMRWGGLAVLAALAVITVANGRAGKYNIPDLPPATRKTGQNPQAGDLHPSQPAPLVRPTAALAAWHPGGRPVLVLVATSGGAYRAAFWTGLLLDRLIEHSRPGGRWPGLEDNIRLFTGASGGMVAAAYFVAMAREDRLDEGVTQRIAADTWTALHEREGRWCPIARDSLSPVVHQMVRRDLPLTLWPFRQEMDRGRSLDAQWITLHRSFAAIRDAEAQGEVPSIILAPMLVESGAVALFSNLDLQEIRKRSVPEPKRPGDENKVSVEVFREFPQAHRTVSLATAVRLNASFPYISPAISLPTWPERRPVDAGYYDNFGIDLLTAYLDHEEISTWIADNCAGVAVIQVRAFPSEVPTAPASWLARALQFVTSPPEGLFNARKASQMFRNDQALVATAKRYNRGRAEGQEFLKVFTFEANTDVSMSWYQRCDEMRALDGLLSPPTVEDLRALYGRDLRPPEGKIDTRTIRLAAVQWATRNWDESMWQLKDTDERFKRGWDEFMLALQRDHPIALRSQYLHHRAKVTAELTALAEFWGRNAAGPARIG